MDKEKPSNEAKGEELFIQLVTMFQVAAMQQMGKILNPVTNKIEIDLEQAKMSIDMISMLKEKTHGNLSKAEEDYMDKVLFELQMDYIDEMNRSKKREEGPSSEASGGDETAQQADETRGSGKKGPKSRKRKGAQGEKDREEPRG
jgi:hypothetical protein